MTYLNDLIDCWNDQRWVALKHLPTDTLGQRAAAWKAHRRYAKRIRGRAGRVALHLNDLAWIKRMSALEASDETYAFTV